MLERLQEFLREDKNRCIRIIQDYELESNLSFEERFDELLIAYKFQTTLQYFSDHDYGHVFKQILDEFVQEIEGIRSIEQPQQRWPHRAVPFVLDASVKDDKILLECINYWNSVFADHAKWVDVEDRLPEGATMLPILNIQRND